MATTPADLLHKVVGRMKAKVSYKYDLEDIDQWQTVHKCLVQVNTPQGSKHSGSGLGWTKKLAKHAAARRVLHQILGPQEADAQLILTPEFIPSSVPGEDVAPALPPFEESVPVWVMKQDNQLWINVPLTSPPPSPVKLEDLVKKWEGPVIHKLLSLSLTKARSLKDPFEVASRLAQEQMLQISTKTMTESGKKSEPKNYACTLNVYQDTPGGQQRLVFSSVGYSKSSDEAREKAAEDFVRMVRIIAKA